MISTFHFIHEKEENSAICDTRMYFEGIMLNEVAREKDEYYIVSLICDVKKNQTQKEKLEKLFPGAEGGRGWRKIQTFSHKIDAVDEDLM